MYGSHYIKTRFCLGLIIFLMHVVLNEQVRKKTLEYLTRKMKNVEDTSYHSRTSTRYKIRPITPGHPPDTGFVLPFQDFHQVQDTSYHSGTSARYRIRPIPPGRPSGTGYVLSLRDILSLKV